MNEQKLKEKVAKFAGFFRVTPEMLIKKSYREVKNMHWHFPDGSPCHFLPNFPNDLTTCFKWLVPKGGIEEITFMFASNVVSCDIEVDYKFYEGHVNVDSFKEAQKKSALALCLAIEKLIDSEVPANPIGFSGDS